MHGNKMKGIGEARPPDLVSKSKLASWASESEVNLPFWGKKNLSREVISNVNVTPTNELLSTRKNNKATTRYDLLTCD